MLDSLKTARDAFCGWPIQSSGQEYPGGPIIESHPLYDLIGNAISTYRKGDPIRRAWVVVKECSRDETVLWDEDTDGDPTGDGAQELIVACNTFRDLPDDEIRRLDLPVEYSKEYPTAVWLKVFKFERNTLFRKIKSGKLRQNPRRSNRWLRSFDLRDVPENYEELAASES
jgi:hypothetical protein